MKTNPEPTRTRQHGTRVTNATSAAEILAAFRAVLTDGYSTYAGKPRTKHQEQSTFPPMTIELTPDQLHDLRESVRMAANEQIAAKATLWDAPQDVRQNLEAEIQKKAQLLNLLEKTTAVILYQP